jgi:hypothetical protein
VYKRKARSEIRCGLFSIGLKDHYCCGGVVLVPDPVPVPPDVPVPVPVPPEVPVPVPPLVPEPVPVPVPEPVVPLPVPVAPPVLGVPVPVPEPVPVAPPVVPVPAVSVIEVSAIVESVIAVSVEAESEDPPPLLFELHAAKTIPENARIINGLKFIVF